MLESYQDVLDIKDMCKALRIGRKTAFRLLQDGQIPYRKIGRNYKIRKDAVITYLEESN
ncbi:MAG: helix-turn-helix domain-containing protein [Ruminococcus sp.]|nr:helix-turn-helix domain-containing protein [Ruminococcus sp.]